MAPLRRIIGGFNALLRKRRVEQELDEELRAYVETSVEEKMRAGMARDDAIRAARVEIGSLEAVKDHTRDSGWEAGLESFWRDVRYAARTLRKSPAFSGVAVLTLALGIGGNTAIFSVIDGVLFRPLPYADPDRLVVVWETNRTRGLPKMVAAPPNLFDWRRQTDVFESIGAYTAASYTLSTGDDAEQVPAARVNVDAFRALRIAPSLGRGFTESDDAGDAARIALLSHGLWQRRFGSDPRVLGRTVILDGRAHEVVGVMPPHFGFPPLIGMDGSEVPVAGELWVPFKRAEMATNRGAHYVTVIGRLKPQANVDRAQEALSVVARRLSDEHPETNAGWSVTVVPLADEVTGDVRPALAVLLAAVGLVLLLACANVAHLVLARHAGRRREIAIRVALGARRLHLARQLLTESLLLASGGAAGGALLAVWAVALIKQTGPSTLPRLDQVSVDLRALAFTGAAALVSAVIFSLIPIMQAMRTREPDWLRERAAAGPGRAHRANALLIAGEAAIAMMLVIAAALLIESFLRLRSVDPGFAAERVLTFRLALPAAVYPTWRQRAGFVGQARDRLSALPGVEAAGAIDAIPLGDDRQGTSFTIDGEPMPLPGEEAATNVAFVSPGYFEAMRVRVKRGRAFDARDRDTAEPVAMVNDALARRFFDNEDPIGRRIRTGFEKALRKIVGVVADERHESLRRQAGPAVYLPYAQAGWGGAPTVAVRFDSGSPVSAESVRSAIRVLDAGVAVYRVRTMNEIVSESIATSRFSTLALGAFAAVALLLAGIGTYGVISYSVGQRTSEIGIRIALGATPGDIVTAVLLKHLAFAGAGIVVGAAAAVALGSALSSMLYGVTATSMPTYVAAAAIVSGAAMAACCVPALRAMRVDPVTALRAE